MKGLTAAALAEQYDKPALAVLVRAHRPGPPSNQNAAAPRTLTPPAAVTATVAAKACATFADKWAAATEFGVAGSAERRAALALPVCGPGKTC